MDKKISFLIVVLFAVLVAFSGCSSKTKTQTTTAQAAFVGGSQGLALSFLPGEPPAQLVDCQHFTAGIQVENKGEANASMVLYLSGIDLDGFNMKGDRAATLNLNPAKKIGQSVVPGQQKVQSFEFDGRDVFATGSFTLYANALYNYQTQAVSSVCLNENVYQQTTGGPETCKVSGTKTVENSGAPIKVTSVEENPGGFIVKVSNSGKGYSFLGPNDILPVINSVTRDTDILSNPDQKDKVKIQAKIGANTLTCSPDAITLVNGAGQTFCDMPTNIKGTFVDLLEMTVSYGYADRTSTAFTIENIPGKTCTAGTGTSANKGKCPDTTSQATLDAVGGCAAITQAQYPNIWTQCNCGA